MRLSLCIATFNRAGYICQTLDAIRQQLTPDVEIVVVDGASEDGTAAVMGQYVQSHPEVVYRRESLNSGVDVDFDKAVAYASGQYCWLMSDDDLLAPGAIAAVLRGLADDPQLLIVNSEIRDRDLAGLLKPRQLELLQDRTYGAADHERFFADVGSYLSFIGAVVVRRDWWLGRERAAYFGTLFVHVGVIFQQPAPERIKVIAAPLVRIRYGNAQWSGRAFDIWMSKWPGLVWSFAHFSEQARRSVSPRYPGVALRTLLWYRAIGAYGPAQLEGLKAGKGQSQHVHALATVAARLPAGFVNAALALICFFSRHGDAKMKLYDLGRAAPGSRLARWLAGKSLVQAPNR